MTEEKIKECLLISQALWDKKTYIELSKEWNVSKNYIYRLMHQYKKEVLHIDQAIDYATLGKILGYDKEIIRLYTEEKMSTAQVGKKFNISGNTVSACLKSWGITVRPFDVPSRLNQSTFSTANNELLAYTIGLITADGSINAAEKSVSICLTQSDGYILEKINTDLLNGNGHILLCHKEDKRPRMVLQFHGKEIVRNLAKYGIVYNKTYCLSALSKEIPEEFYHHYIRGLFDGDGVCSKSDGRVSVGYCAHQKEFTADFANKMHELLNLPKNKLFNTGGCWDIRWGAVKDVINFYNYIYKDATIFLGRKKIKIYNYIVNTELIKSGKILLTA